MKKHKDQRNRQKKQEAAKQALAAEQADIASKTLNPVRSPDPISNSLKLEREWYELMAELLKKSEEDDENNT